MKIAVDAMGGDYPSKVIIGAAQGSILNNVPIVFVGKKFFIEETLREREKEFDFSRLQYEIVHTDGFIAMDEHVKATADILNGYSSMGLAARLVNDDKADALFSCGNTAALTILAYGQLIKGIERPAISTVLPGKIGPVIFLDAGASADCNRRHLLQFANMGSIYATAVLGKERPVVRLLNIGEEEGKGDLLMRNSFPLLQSSDLNFAGNIEGHQVLNQIKDKIEADVVVAGGTHGNIWLKATEGTFSRVKDEMREFYSLSIFHRLLGLFALPLKYRLSKKFDYEAYGGAPILGPKFMMFKGHGRSSVRAAQNAIGVIARLHQFRLVEKIAASVSAKTE